MQTEDDTTERPHKNEIGERETAVVQEVKPAAKETSEDPATPPPKAPEKEKSVESWLPPRLVADVADTALLQSDVCLPSEIHVRTFVRTFETSTSNVVKHFSK